MLLWIISGACRGVGKTYLAKGLCALLPASAYAKLGHGARRPHKSANLLHGERELAAFVESHREECEHLIIESNSIQPTSAPAVRIFLEAPRDRDDLRADRQHLLKRAHIRVHAAADPARWEAALGKHIQDTELREAVLSLLAEQQRRLKRTKLAVRSKVWLVNEDEQHVFGSGLAKLLEEVAHLGSLRAAAEAEGMSYRHAWGAIRQAERNLGVKLLDPRTGGAGGGGSVLTAEAKRVLALFRRLSEKSSAAADKEFAARHGREPADHA